MSWLPRPGSSIRRWWWLWAAAAWTAVVWVGRIRNALGDPAMDGAARGRMIALSCVFLAVAALAVLWALAARDAGAAPAGLRRFVGIVAAATGIYWLVRLLDIAFGEHDPAFVVVHAVLGVLAVGTWTMAYVTAPEARSEEIPDPEEVFPRMG